MKTTLNKIREHEPCKAGWEKLLTYLGKTKADDEPLAITTVLDSNGLDDALWCLRAVEGYDREIRLFAVWCARQVQHLMKDRRSRKALDIAECYANGEATEKERKAAYDAAYAAAAWAAWDAAYATEAATKDAAYAAYAAADAAAEAADNDSSAAAFAARDAAMAAAASAAGDEMKAKQEAELRRICKEVTL